jgi:4-amino-4-deoxy-L-arabinose transferase-like glycosyltransferase
LTGNLEPFNIFPPVRTHIGFGRRSRVEAIRTVRKESMEQPEAGEVAKDRQLASAERSKDWQALLLLLLVTLTLRIVMLCRTEVPARDSIGYIRYALEFERADLSWGDVLRKNHQHPGYPLVVLGVSYPVRYFLGGITPYSMQLSAQLASGLAALLLVVPMFLLGKLLRDRRLGFWAALLFQFLPVVSHILTDGISEAVFLLWCVWGMYFGCKGLQGAGPRAFALCGLFSGLAYLTRPEGALVVVAAALTLTGVQMLSAWRQPWPRWLLGAAALGFPALLLGGIYCLATGHFTNKPTVNHMLRTHVTAPEPSNAAAYRGPLFAAFIKSAPPGTWQRFTGAVLELGTEIVAGLHYFWVFPAVLGLWWQRALTLRSPARLLLGMLCLLYLAVLVRLGMIEGYISNRHVLIVVMCGTYAAVWALCDWPLKIPGSFFARGKTVISLACLLLVMATCLPKTLQPLHGNRAGHHAAGLWLAQKVHAGDEVKDDHCWAHYFAGQVFIENKPLPHVDGARCYTVISRSRDPENHARQEDEEKVVQEGAEVVYRWPEERPLDSAKVVVYASPRK